jgi:hypothetical protein
MKVIPGEYQTLFARAFHSGGYDLSRHAVNLNATNSKDYVYVLSAVSGSKVVEVEYGTKKTVAKVYEDYAAHWLDSIVYQLGDNQLTDLCDL